MSNKPKDPFTRLLHRSCKADSIYRHAAETTDAAGQRALAWLRRQDAAFAAADVVALTGLLHDTGDEDALALARAWFEREGVAFAVGDLIAMARQLHAAARQIDDALDSDDGEEMERASVPDAWRDAFVEHLAECPHCWEEVSKRVAQAKRARQALGPSHDPNTKH